ncbi:MAG: hypothetical protein M3340_02360 [Actinomycetota bacterium]|nr:hypothetical protein [Actinomycetota bacterium]
MTRIRSRALGLLAALALIAAAPTASGAAGSSPSITAAKSCSSGYRHAILPNGHKCLRAGQFCKKAWDGRYHKYGFHCHNGRLKRK